MSTKTVEMQALQEFKVKLKVCCSCFCADSVSMLFLDVAVSFVRSLFLDVPVSFARMPVSRCFSRS